MEANRAIAEFLRKIASIPVPASFDAYVEAEVARARQVAQSHEERVRLDALIGLREELPKLKAMAQEMLDQFYG